MTQRGSIALARSLCYQIAGAADERDDLSGAGYGSVDIAEILSAEVLRLQAAQAQAAVEPAEANNDEVICPNCCNQFRAIPVNVQQLMLDAGFEPPFTSVSLLSKDPAINEPVAYLAWRDGNPCYEGDDAVCEDAVWPVDFDDDRTSMPVYTASAIAAARVAALEEAAKVCEHEACSCCWTEDATELASHLTDSIRALIGETK